MDDSEIIELFVARSEHAVNELHEKYGKLCMHLARSILRDMSEAEECVNDAYLGVWNAIPPAQPQILSAFVCRITRNLALKRLEYLNAAKRSRSRTINLDELDECINDDSTIESRCDDRELAALINKFLASLDKTKCDIFVLRYWYNASINDISLKYGFSQSKVESILYRLRQRLKKHIDVKGY